MEPHSWIYVIVTLVYLYFLSQIIDRNRQLMIRKSRIHLPSGELNDEERYMSEMSELHNDQASLRKGAMLIFMVIPIVEMIVHVLIGEYTITDQILSAALFVMFFVSLLLILFTMKGRKRQTQKKYTHDPRIQFD